MSELFNANGYKSYFLFSLPLFLASLPPSPPCFPPSLSSLRPSLPPSSYILYSVLSLFPSLLPLLCTGRGTITAVTAL